MRSAALLPLALALLTPAFSQSLRTALVTKDAPGAGCAVPASGTSFPVDTPRRGFETDRVQPRAFWCRPYFNAYARRRCLPPGGPKDYFDTLSDP